MFGMKNALIRKSSSILLMCAFVFNSLAAGPRPGSGLRKEVRVDLDDDSRGDLIPQRSELTSETMYRQALHQMEIEKEQLQQQIINQQHDIDALHKKYQPKNRAQNTLFSELAESSPEVKDEVISLIIDKFTESDAHYKRFEKLDSAFEAMEFLITDGEPVGVEEYPFLYVGSVGASLNHEALMANNITHVVNWSGSAKCNVWAEIEYRCITDIHGQDMSKPENVKVLRDAVEFVEESRLAGGTVLSHCWFGRNRSVTLLVAYLMKYAGMSIEEATRQVAKTRPQADPYNDALRLYKKLYLDASA